MQYLLRFLFILVIHQSVAVLTNVQQDLTAQPNGFNEASLQYLPPDKDNRQSSRNSITQAGTGSPLAKVAANYIQGQEGSYQYNGLAQQYRPSAGTQENQGPYQNMGVSQITQDNQSPYQYNAASQQNLQDPSQHHGPAQQNLPSNSVQNNQGRYETPQNLQDPSQYHGPVQQNLPINTVQNNQGRYETPQNVPATPLPSNPGGYQYQGYSQQNLLQTSATNNQGSPQQNVVATPATNNRDLYQNNVQHPQYNHPASSSQTNQYYGSSQRDGPVSPTSSHEVSYQNNHKLPQQNGPTQLNQGPAQPQVNPSHPQQAHYPTTEDIRSTYQHSQSPQQNAATSVGQNQQGSYQSSGASPQNVGKQDNQDIYQHNQSPQQNSPIVTAQNQQASYHSNGFSPQNSAEIQTQVPKASQSSSQQQGAHQPNQFQNTPNLFSMGSAQYQDYTQDSRPTQGHQGPEASESSSQQTGSHQPSLSQNIPNHSSMEPSQYQEYNQHSRPTQGYQGPEASQSSSQQTGSHQSNLSQNTPHQSTAGPAPYQDYNQHIHPLQSSATTTGNQEASQIPKPSQKYLPPTSQSAEPAQLQTPSADPRPSQHYQTPNLEQNQQITSNTSPQQEPQSRPSSGDFNTQHSQEPQRATTTTPAPTSTSSYHGPDYQYLPATTVKPNRTAANPTYNNDPWNPIKANNLQTTTSNMHVPVSLPQGYRYNTPAQKQPSSHAQTFNGVIYNELGMGMNNVKNITKVEPDSEKTEIETQQGYVYGKPGEIKLNENANSKAVTHLMPVPTMPSSYIYYRPQEKNEGSYNSPQNQTNNYQQQEFNGNSRPSNHYYPQHNEGNSNGQQSPQTGSGNSTTIPQNPTESSSAEPAGNQRPSAPGFPTDYIASAQQTQSEQYNPAANGPSLASARPGNTTSSQEPTTPEHAQVRPTVNNSYQHSGTYQTTQSNQGQVGYTGEGTSTQQQQYPAQSSSSVNPVYQVPQREPTRYTSSNQLENKDYSPQGSFSANRNPFNTEKVPESQNGYTTNQNALPSLINPPSSSQNSNYPLTEQSQLQRPNQVNTQYQPQQNPGNSGNEAQVLTEGNRQLSAQGQMSQDAAHVSLAHQPGQSSSYIDVTQSFMPLFRPSTQYNFPSNFPDLPLSNYPQGQFTQSIPQGSLSQSPDQTNSNQLSTSQFQPSPQQQHTQGNINLPPVYYTQSQQGFGQINPPTQDSFANQPQISPEVQGNPSYSYQLNLQNPSQQPSPLNQAPNSPSQLPLTERQRLEMQGLSQSQSPAEEQRGTLIKNQQTFLAEPTTALQITGTNSIGNIYGATSPVSDAETNPTSNAGNLSRNPESKPITFEETKTFKQMPSYSFELPSYYTMVPNNVAQAPGMAHHPNYMTTSAPTVSDIISSQQQQQPMAPIVVSEQKPMIFGESSSPLPLPNSVVFVETPQVPQEPIRQPHLIYGSPVSEASNIYLPPPSMIMNPPYLKK